MNSYVREIRGMLVKLGLARSSSWKAGTFLAGAGFGVVAGAAAAALLAPTDGKEMRKLVQSKAKQIASKLEKEMPALTGALANGHRRATRNAAKGEASA